MVNQQFLVHHQFMEDARLQSGPVHRIDSLTHHERRSGSQQAQQGQGQQQPNSKRKRSWSRAVFSNLQRKGLEIAFGSQKYITKPDRRKLAARLGLTDAQVKRWNINVPDQQLTISIPYPEQVKVWFQNRRMKWRHTGEDRKLAGSGQTISNKSKDDQMCTTTSEEETGDEDEIDVTD